MIDQLGLVESTKLTLVGREVMVAAGCWGRRREITSRLEVWNIAESRGGTSTKVWGNGKFLNKEWIRPSLNRTFWKSSSLFWTTLPNIRTGEVQHSDRNKIQETIENTACIISYNSRGSSDQKLQFMKYLVSSQCVGNKIPILSNQENFLLKANTYKLFQMCPDFQFFLNPAVKDVQNSGRPKNGMFTCVPSTIKSYVSDVSPGHWRVQAINIARSQKAALRNLIGFGGVKLFLLKFLFFFSFVTIWVFEFCHNLSCWVLSQI